MPYPVGPLEEAIVLAQEIYRLGAGEKVRRLNLFNSLGKSPDSSTSRLMITNSNKYGFTKGGYQADFLELTEKGKVSVSGENSPVLSLKAKFELGVDDIPVYKYLYEKYSGNKLPVISVISDLLIEQFKDITNNEANEFVETFIVNIKYLGLLQNIAGAERLITLEHALEKIPHVDRSVRDSNRTIDLIQIDSADKSVITYGDFDNICFYITPIGAEDSEFRKHSDLFLENIIIPAIQGFNLKVVRADQIDKPGTITNQIIEYILKSKLVIADLSFHNPNVFYELALRHTCRLPTVQIIRKADFIPFDLSHSRTIQIDTTDIYTLCMSSNQSGQMLTNS